MLAPEWYLAVLLGVIAAITLRIVLLRMMVANPAALKTGTISDRGLPRRVRFRYHRERGRPASRRAIIYESEERRGYIYLHGTSLPDEKPVPSAPTGSRT